MAAGPNSDDGVSSVPQVDEPADFDEMDDDAGLDVAAQEDADEDDGGYF